MTRPCKPRRLCGRCPDLTWKPTGIPMHLVSITRLGLDEWESLRMIDGEGRHHEDVAVSMGVSRSTVTRIIRRARRKLVKAMEEGHAIRIAPAIDHQKGEEHGT